MKEKTGQTPPRGANTAEFRAGDCGVAIPSEEAEIGSIVNHHHFELPLHSSSHAVELRPSSRRVRSLFVLLRRHGVEAGSQHNISYANRRCVAKDVHQPTGRRRLNCPFALHHQDFRGSRRVALSCGRPRRARLPRTSQILDDVGRHRCSSRRLVEVPLWTWKHCTARARP